MGLNLSLEALTLPANTEFPGTMQQLQDLVAQYMDIVGEANFSGINYGPVTPDPINRDRPWFKTDLSSQPLGWYAWNGIAWVPAPLFPQSGTLAAAPVSGSLGQLYYASDIKVMCMFNGGSWVTLAGVSGEIKFVRGTSVTEVLAKFPGWVAVEDMVGYVPGVAGTDDTGFSTSAPESNGGERTHTMTVDELVAHTHTYNTAPTRGGKGGANPIWANNSTVATGSTGGGVPFNVMQPTWFLIAIQKV